MYNLEEFEKSNQNLTLEIVRYFRPNYSVQFTNQYHAFDASIFTENLELHSILETKVRNYASTQFSEAAMVINQDKVGKLKYWSKKLGVPSFITQFYLGDRVSYTYKLTNEAGKLIRELEAVKNFSGPYYGADYRVEKDCYYLPFDKSLRWKF